MNQVAQDCKCEHIIRFSKNGIELERNLPNYNLVYKILFDQIRHHFFTLNKTLFANLVVRHPS